MLTAFKILTMLWPFIKEMLFGQKTMRQILKEHKGTVAATIIVAAVVVTNLFIFNRLIVISNDYLTLQKKYAVLEKAHAKAIVVQAPRPVMKPPPAVTAPAMMPVAPVAKPNKPKKPIKAAPPKKPTDERYHRIKESFIELQEGDPPEPVSVN